MPQLDFLVIQTESFILPSFFLYYFIFVKKIEPLLTFQLRVKKFYGKYYFEWLCFFLPEYRIVFPDRMYPMDLYYLQGVYYSSFDECNRNYFRIINY